MTDAPAPCIDRRRAERLRRGRLARRHRRPRRRHPDQRAPRGARRRLRRDRRVARLARRPRHQRRPLRTRPARSRTSSPPGRSTACRTSRGSDYAPELVTDADHPSRPQGPGRAGVLGVRGRHRRRRDARRRAARPPASPTSTSSASPPTTACGRPRSTRGGTGFAVRLLDGLHAGVAPETSAAALAEMAAGAGGRRHERAPAVRGRRRPRDLHHPRRRAVGAAGRARRGAVRRAVGPARRLRRAGRGRRAGGLARAARGDRRREVPRPPRAAAHLLRPRPRPADARGLGRARRARARPPRADRRHRRRRRPLVGRSTTCSPTGAAAEEAPELAFDHRQILVDARSGCGPSSSTRRSPPSSSPSRSPSPSCAGSTPPSGAPRPTSATSAARCWAPTGSSSRPTATAPLRRSPALLYRRGPATVIQPPMLRTGLTHGSRDHQLDDPLEDLARGLVLLLAELLDPLLLERVHVALAVPGNLPPGLGEGDQLGPSVGRVLRHLQQAQGDHVADRLTHRLLGDARPGRHVRGARPCRRQRREDRVVRRPDLRVPPLVRRMEHVGR